MPVLPDVASSSTRPRREPSKPNEWRAADKRRGGRNLLKECLDHMLPQKKGPGDARAFLVPALVIRANDYVVFTDARRNGTRPMMGRQQVHLVPGSVENI